VEERKTWKVESKIEVELMVEVEQHMFERIMKLKIEGCVQTIRVLLSLPSLMYASMT
jgi:hypothetical protein